MLNDWQHGGFGLYLHWPFCQAKCPYCDFNSHVSREVDQDAWLEGFKNEISLYSRQTEGRTLDSIFFGGGTPSLMTPKTVEGILDTVRSHWALDTECEITMEANPTSVEAANFEGYRKAGVNRLSLGVQSLNDLDLKRLGRLHDVAQAMNAIELARSVFDNMSFDLIYARQDQTIEDWEDELHRALALEPSHISLYQLTIEAGTAFGDRFAAGMLKGLPSEDLAADMYDLTISTCADAGLLSYEVSNFARPGVESRHNRVYWRTGDYIGIGPGAHGRITVNGTRYATEAAKMPAKWLDMASEAGAETVRAKLNAKEMEQEFLLMGLRLTEGVDLARHPSLIADPDFLKNFKYLKDLELIKMVGDRLIVTPQGRPLLNSVTRQLLAD
ncbi:coproporphyrinogen III oxidase [Alphaproteobacteria bacterium KMM 3653]|uniref:Heme chaperone HemW n=1 Tax=Harenicola maris TaxID=2841044 RepID=A0AAP2G4A5_9RHOB|nr:coproporphyrinogen III oxidase [Harenicola maris]